MTKACIPWSAKTLANQMKNGKVNFDNAVQRGLVWDKDKKSLLIHSMIYEYPIPPLYFIKENGIYDSLDGKQRSNAISEFLNGEFALTENTPPVVDKEAGGDEPVMLDIAGMTYDDLPEWAQSTIKDYGMTIYYFENITEAEIREMFRRLNNGKPLTAVELTRVNTPCLVEFQQLAAHDAIQNVTTDAARKRFTDENIAMQIYHMVTEDKPDFSTQTVREWAKSVQTDEEIMGKIHAGLDAYCEFFSTLDSKEDKSILRAVKTRTHFVSCAYYCYLALQEEKTQDEINSALREFFSGKPSVSDEYNQTVGSGSAKPTAVQTRQRVMRELAGVQVEEQAAEENNVEGSGKVEDDESQEQNGNEHSTYLDRVYDDVVRIAEELEQEKQE